MTCRRGLVSIFSIFLSPAVALSQAPRLVVNTGHTSSVHSVAFSPDGKTFASGSGNLTVKLWDHATCREIRTLLGHPLSTTGTPDEKVGLLAFGAEGKTVAVGSWDFPVKIWDVQSSTAIHTLPGHRFTKDHGPLDAFGTIVAISSDGATVASGSQDRDVKLWDAVTGGPLATLSGHSCGIVSLSFSPSGKALHSMSHDGNVRIWSVDGPRSREIASIHFFPDGSWVVVDPGGRFDASDPEIPHLHWVDHDEVQPLSRPGQEFHRPDLLAEILASK